MRNGGNDRSFLRRHFSLSLVSRVITVRRDAFRIGSVSCISLEEDFITVICVYKFSVLFTDALADRTGGVAHNRLGERENP